MEPAMVSQVRRFNRIVTQRVGALDDRFHGRDLPLGEARLLWEIGPEGCELRTLRARVDLDSGYLSRMLRSLETAGLVSVEPGEDRRVRVARLTAAGLDEREVLDQRSDDAAESLLEPLTGGQRERLVDAMREVERLMTASMVVVEEVDPADPAAQYCLREYGAELGRRFEMGFDPAHISPGDYRRPHGLMLLATLAGEPVGCGALWFHPGAPPDIKRMWVSPHARGLGLGRRLLAELEARVPGDVVRLETNRALAEAIAMYRSAGYVEIAPFNDERYAHHWFEKRLTRAPSGARRPRASTPR
jgi:DNA-binding MarR family transcriptional regulator/GNAT superfamily N-acetyltransferase